MAERFELRSLLHRVLLGATAVALLTGCTTTTPGQATSAPGDPTETSSDTTSSSDGPDSDELPSDGAPEVDDPLDTTKFQDDPCLSLTTEQSQGTFNLSPSGKPYKGELGKACEWQNESTSARADVRFLDDDPRGLSAQYTVNEEGRWAFFEELSIEGYPAVARGLTDRRDSGACTVVVGASDEIAFEVAVELSLEDAGKQDSCETAADVAGEAVKTMKAG